MIISILTLTFSFAFYRSKCVDCITGHTMIVSLYVCITFITWSITYWTLTGALNACLVNLSIRDCAYTLFIVVFDLISDEWSDSIHVVLYITVYGRQLSSIKTIDDCHHPIDSIASLNIVSFLDGCRVYDS